LTLMRHTDKFSSRILAALIFTALISGVVWVVGPSVYVSVVSLLPPGIQSGLGSPTEKASRRLGKLEAQLSEETISARQSRIFGAFDTSATTTLPNSQRSANVLARPPQTPYDVLLVDAGKKSGITVGAAVWWPPGVYLGEVIDVRTHSSLIRLVTSAGVRHTVRLHDRLTTKTVGRGGAAMQATVPGSADISTGTLAVSDRFRAPLGRVVGSRMSATPAEKTLLIQPLVPASVIE